MLEIVTLGGLTIKEDGVPLTRIQTRKAEAMLVYLAIEGGDHRRDSVATLLWPEKTEQQARRSLRVALANLRKELGRYLLIDRSKLSIRPDADVYVDANDLIAKASNGNHQAAVTLYRGAFLRGFYVRGGPDFDQWQSWESEHILSEVLNALHLLLEQTFGRGDYPQAAEHARHLIKLDPLDERGYWFLISSLAKSGQRSAAMTAYNQCLQILDSELGIKPGKEIEDLHAALSTGIGDVIRPAIPRQQRLPLTSNTFVGREADLARISQQILKPSSRLVTIVGPGGIGKTRLAVQLAQRLSRTFSDGVGFAPLGAVSSTEMLVFAIADSVGFTFDAITLEHEPKDQLLDFLANKELLLILDSFEHLISEESFLVDVWKRAPGVKVLVTSRERLNLQGEWVYFLEGLSVPDEAAPVDSETAASIVLFLDRAQQAGCNQAFTDSEICHVAEICQRVEGMPLAIELAAAWTPILSAVEIEEEIKKNIDFLAAPTRDLPGKHRSLRAVFEHSWTLLAPTDQAIYRNLSVFQGGFSRSAAREVAGASLSRLLALHGKSLIRRSATDRFDIHGLLQMFAAEQLEDEPEALSQLMERYCGHYLGILLRNETRFIGPSMVGARKQVRDETRNIRYAVIWTIIHGQSAEAIHALRAFFSYYVVHGWYDGIIAFRHLAQIVLEHRDSGALSLALRDPVYLSARAHRAFFCSELGLIAEAGSISEECLEPALQLEMHEEASLCLLSLGINSSFQGEYRLSIEQLTEAIEVGRFTACVAWPAYFLWLGYTHFLQGNYQAGMDNFQICNQLFLEKGSSWGQGFALSKMTLAATGLKDYQQAIEYGREALAIFEGTNDLEGQAYALSRLSLNAYSTRDYQKALRYGKRGHELFFNLGHKWGTRIGLCRIGFAYIGLNKLKLAKKHFREALSTSREDRMVPLQLSALLGLASVMSIEGKPREALDLLLLAKRHPRTPAIYMDVSLRWFPEEVADLVSATAHVKDEAEILARFESAIDAVLQANGPITESVAGSKEIIG
jgi:predicted ATPase/DNA-binding SARP family transcriptional activator